ncbi:hypothetical protein BGZ61DRAFT_154768 [Ilyonectria robusta]|uniref:uncharacterized protein n=1 Tax=Ilyonectria robusta TaxID=1079257 RepID=UPI001E8E1F68|nr:uncharacterized protein BGZ61DRAFT_154768 [Ilyonectria robusta]KAH8659704.1 hypothetical protein BGZ61DRAFT_154768 [Ilyonectria robusta]
MFPQHKMAGSGIRFALSARGGHISIRLLFSYAFDWLFLIVVAAIAALLGRIEPKKRPFSLVDPDISFPFTEHETVPSFLLLILCAVVPICIIAYRLHHLRAWPNRAQRHSQDIDMEAKALGAPRGLAGSCVSSCVSMVLH